MNSNSNLKLSAYDAVANAIKNPGEWFGWKGQTTQVIFANGVLTVSDNGDAQDYDAQTEQDKAAEALFADWQRE